MKIRITAIIFLLFFSCKEKSGVSKKQINVEPKTLGEVRKVLDSIHSQDQKYRLKIESIYEKYGKESVEIKDYWKKISQVDSSNLVVVEKILNKFGWLSSAQIGSTANSTLFLVIQHSDLKTQERYLPMMRKAVKERKASASSLALLEDRVHLRKREPQVYGSQIGTDSETGKKYVLPLVDPENVNVRRAEVGLGKIEDYISNWNLTWDVEEYKKELPRLLEKLKEGRR